MRVGYLVLAVFLTALLAGLVGTGTLIAIDLAGWERPADARYSLQEMVVVAGVLMSLVSIPAIAVGLVLCALPITLAFHARGLPAALRDLLLLIILPLLGHLALSNAFASTVPIGPVYGLLAAMLWISFLRILPIRAAAPRRHDHD